MLQAWCRQEQESRSSSRSSSRVRGEPESEFEASGRPAIIAASIKDAFARGLTPAFWKIEGTSARDGAQAIDAAIAEDPGGRQIILGKAADLATIARWFEAAAQSRTASGFAIGRSVFWEPSAAFLAGTQTADQAADLICRQLPAAHRCVGRITVPERLHHAAVSCDRVVISRTEDFASFRLAPASLQQRRGCRRRGSSGESDRSSVTP